MVKDEDRAMGLMFRPSLPPTARCSSSSRDLDFHGIWMKNCRFPIDIVWLDENRKVVHVAASVPAVHAGSLPGLPAPCGRAAYVVEMNAGAARREKIAVGAALGFTLPR